MSGDLISREALKKAFEDLFYNDFDDQIRTERLIDNAPTVSPYKAIHDELHKGEENDKCGAVMQKGGAENG